MTNTSGGPIKLDLTESVPFLTLLTIISVTSIGSNSLIVGIICKHSQQRKSYDVFTLHSSLVDLLTALVVTSFWILTAIYSDVHFVGDVFCKVSATVSFMELLAPIFFLTLVAASRHCALVDRKAFPRIFSDSKVRIMVALVWFAAILISIPPHFTWPVAPEVLCLPDLMTNSWYTTAVLAFCVLLPLSAAFYAHLYDIFIFQPERLKPNTSVRKRCERYSLRGGELTTQKALFSIVLLHTLCWMPYMCVAMIYAMNGAQAFYLGKVPLHFVALVVGLTGTSLKGIVTCFEVPHLKALIKKQFGCVDEAGDTSQAV